MNRADRPTRARDEHISPLRLSTYADGETPREERTEIEAHLSVCPTCSARLDALRSVSATLAGLPRTTPSEGVWDEVLAGARREARASTAVSRERLGRRRGNGPIRLRNVRLPEMAPARPTTPARRRSRWRMPFPGALPTIAALALIGLAMSLLMRSSLVTINQTPSATPTATLAPGDTLKATQRAITAATRTRNLPFKPVEPTYLPAGAQLGSVTVDILTSGARYLDITWTFGAGPLAKLRLREQPVSAPTNAYTSPAAQMKGLAWQVNKSQPWRAMAQVEGAGMSGVEQERGDVRLMLEVQPAGGASPSDVATALRFTSLSMDVGYHLPRVAIGGPATGTLTRAISTVTGAGGQTWGWDVTSSPGPIPILVNSNITLPNGAKITQITRSGAGVRLDWSHGIYQSIPGPTLYNEPRGVTQIAFDASSFLVTGQLWNLGKKTIPLPDKRTMDVYDLYRVDTAQPEHVYADAVTGAVVAIFVDTDPAAVSPGGPGSSQPYVSTAACSPYTVTYNWIIYEPATQSASLFNTAPPHGWKQGAVPLPFTCGG